MLDNLLTSITLLVVGMSCVLLSLNFLSVVIWFLKKSDDFIENRKKIKSNPEIQTENTNEIIEENEDEIAVIAAAVIQLYFGKQTKVKTIKFLKDDSSNWASQGRASIMNSHKIGGRAF